jgi:hypothetical protein
MNDTIEQALEALRQRCAELVRLGLAQDYELARALDQLHVELIERYTVRKAGEQCR